MTKRVGIFSILLLMTCMGFLSSSVVMGANLEFDFGLPLFGGDEVRYERDKQPDFNFQLLKKYLSENSQKPLHHFHAFFAWMNLIRLSPANRHEELKAIVLKHFSPGKFDPDDRMPGLDALLARGLFLAREPAEPGKTEPDEKFEELLLEAETGFKTIPEYHLLKGILFKFLQESRGAFWAPMKPIEDLKRAAAGNPANPHFFFVLGQAFRNLGNHEPTLFLAVVSYEKAAGAVPSNGKLQHHLLSIYMGLHEEYQNLGKPEPFWLEEAVYKKILLVSPNNPYALNNLGYLYAEYGINRELAQSLCQRAVDQLPDNAGFRDSLGWAAFKNQNYEKAVSECLKSVSLNPDVYEPHYHLGTVYYVRGQYDKAIEMYEKAIALKPASAETLNNYAYLLTELDRDHQKALEMGKKAVKLDPGNASYIDTLGWANFRLGNLDEALRLLKKAQQITPNVGEILLHLGKVYLELGEFDSGVDYLKGAFKADPNLSDIQKELYLAFSIRSQFQSLGEYHKLFGAKADPRHLNNQLLSLVRTYQEEGLFSKAIEITKLCDGLKKNQIDLGKPLFSFYAIETASSTEGATASPPEIILEPDESAASQTGAIEQPTSSSPGAAEESESAEISFPKLPHVSLGMNIGPAFFRFLGQFLLPFPGFEDLSVSVYLPEARLPFSSAVFQVELPGMEKRDALGAFEAYFQGLGISLSEGRKNFGEMKGISVLFGRKPLWAAQSGNRFFFGFSEMPDPGLLRDLELAFPYKPVSLLGFLLDWSVLRETAPFYFRLISWNPIWPYTAAVSQSWKEGSIIRETWHLRPATKVDQKFMKILADQMFFFKFLLGQIGIGTELQVKAAPECVQVKIGYAGIVELYRTLKDRLWIFALPFKPRIDKLVCMARRLTYGQDLERLQEVCPTQGKVTFNPYSGTLECEQHIGSGFVPFVVGQERRCRLSRKRLEEINKNLPPKFREKIGKGLIKRLLLDYNILPCQKNGEFRLEENGSVSCSFHKDREEATPNPEPRNNGKKQEEQ